MTSIVENYIASSLIRRALARNWTVTVNDGEEFVLHKSHDEHAIWDAMRSTDEDYLIFYDGEHRIGFVWLIWGNDEDLISDHTANPEIDTLVDEVNKLTGTEG